MNSKNVLFSTTALLTALSCGADGADNQIYDAKIDDNQTTLPSFEGVDAVGPNFLVFVADDLLSSELGCYGGVNVATPNIDKLAEEGVRFTHNYASMAMSVPIRASMYTGLYPARNGAYQNHKLTYDGVESVLDYMPQLGYKVGRTGKTHFSSRTEADFDVVDGFTVACTSSTADYDVEGVRDYIKGNDSFLLYVCSIHPHSPWTWGDSTAFDPDEIELPEYIVDIPDMRDSYTTFLAEVKALDEEVGAVMDVLEESGKMDNTVVIFLGEQGPQMPGCKWTLWQPGVSSAMIVRYPKKIKAGSLCEAIVQYEDILPTIIDIAGGEAIDNMDGLSFRSALYGESNTHREYAYGIHNNIPAGTAYPIRSIRNESYSLIVNLTPDVNFYVSALMTGAMWSAWVTEAGSNTVAKTLVDRYLTRPAVEFYDLKSDPFELNNLAEEPEHQDRINTMRAKLDAWMQQQGDTGADMDVEF